MLSARIITGSFPKRFSSLLSTATNRSQRNLAQKKEETRSSSSRGHPLDEPIPFFGSQAANWQAKSSRSGGADDDHLWYQPYVITGSLAVFLIYFCVLREESDIDMKLEGSLYDHVEGLEEVQLTMNYKYNKEHGLDTKEIEERLKDLGIDAKQLNLQN